MLNKAKTQNVLGKTARCTPGKPSGALRFLPAAAFWLVAFSAQAQTAVPAAASPSGPKVAMHSNMTGSPDMKQSIKSGMDNMQQMQMSGNTNRDFAVMMKIHHQQALDMAEMQLTHGKSPELKAMASQIISGQKKEIAQFDRWLAKQK